MATYEIEVPAKFADASCGVTLDVGSSLIKIIHVPADAKKAGGLNKAVLSTFPTSELTKALDFARGFCNANNAKVTVTGGAAPAHEAAISSALGKAVEFIPRIDTCARAFIVGADSFSRDTILLPFNAEFEDLSEQLRQKAVAKLRAENVNTRAKIPILDVRTERSAPSRSSEPLSKAENIYPCLMVIIGSGISYVKMSGPQSYELVDESSRGGRLFSDLGSFLCGTNDYGKLMDLAMKGQHQFSKIDALPLDKGMSMEAKAFGLLLTLIKDIAMGLTLEGNICGADKVFVGGGFISHQLVRDLLLQEFNLRKMYRDKPNEINFLKDATHLGAIGALVWE